MMAALRRWHDPCQPCFHTYTWQSARILDGLFRGFGLEVSQSLCRTFESRSHAVTSHASSRCFQMPAALALPMTRRALVA